MKHFVHTTATSNHYNLSAKNYDNFNEVNSKDKNQLIEKLLQACNVQSVLDMTCGTGSQVFWLKKKGFDVVGSDINSRMLDIARRKALDRGVQIDFIKDDVRSVRLGSFDAVITIFNSIGHLTKSDFEIAMKNIYMNLNPKGIYIFDILNLTYLLKTDNITKLTLDFLRKVDERIIRYIQYSTINERGILTSYTTSLEQNEDETFVTRKTSQTLQVYNVEQLQTMLQKSGFKILQTVGGNGEPFDRIKSKRLFVVAERLD